MSGTSLDGIDAALVAFENDQAEIVEKSFTPYRPDLRDNLSEITTGKIKPTLEQLLNLDHQIGLAFANAALPFTNHLTEQITAIGSHGQTVYHAPEVGNSWQLGDPNLIAEITGVTTVSDFRRRDMAAGGQGAPLTPAFHASQFSQQKPIAVLNLGGIANLTCLAGGNDSVITLGFDTGPANTLLDQWIKKTRNLSFDHNGEWALQGSADQELLKQLRSDPYFQLPAPKSTGTDYFNLSWLQNHMQSCSSKLQPEDVQATLLLLTSTTVIDAINQYADDAAKVILCGGGVKNTALKDELVAGRPDIHWVSSTKYGIDSDYLEAAAFAWLAKQAVERTSLDLRNVTGARHPVILGAIYPASGPC